MRPHVFVAVVILFSSVSFTQATKSTAPPQTPRQALLEVITAKDPAAAIERHLPELTKKYWAAHLKDLPSIMGATIGSAMAGSVLTDDGVGFDMPKAASGFETFTAGPILLRDRDARSGTVAELRIDADDFAGDEDTMDLSLHVTGADGEPIALPIQPPTMRLKMKLELGVWRFEEVAFTSKLPLNDLAFVKQTARQQAEMNQLMVTNTVDDVVAAEAKYLHGNHGRGFTCSLAQLAPADKQSDDAKMWDATLQFAQQKGYQLQLTDCTSTNFHAAAVPQQSGQPVFCSDQSGAMKKSNKSVTDCFAAGEPVREDNAGQSSPQ